MFRQSYGYYMIGDRKIVFPVEDSLLSLYPALASNKSGEESSLPCDLVERLPDTFSKELQIWNLLVENSSFFETKEKRSISDIERIVVIG